MFTEQRRSRDRPGGVRKLDAEPGGFDLATHRMRQLDQHLARRDLRMVEHLRDRQNWAGWNPALVELIDPMLRWMRDQRPIDLGRQRVAILEPVPQHCKALVARELGSPDHRNESPPHRLVADSDIEGPIGPLKLAMR